MRYFNVLALSVLCVFLPQATLANPSGGVMGVEPATAPMSALTKSELQTWKEAYWEWHETGVVPQWATDFTFTHPSEIPENLVVFADAYIVFGKMYRHRLQPDPRLPNYYSLDDFLRDSPAVFENFKHYSITGELITPEDDLTASIEHVSAVVAAMDDPEASGFSVSQFDFSEDAVVSDLGWGNQPNPGDNEVEGDVATIAPTDPQPTPQLPDVLECLKYFVENSLLGAGCPGDPRYNSVSSCLFKKDVHPSYFLIFQTDPGVPGFDCDDFADALIAYLLRNLRGMYPDMQIYQLVHWYTDCNGNIAGHAVVYIEIDGYYYIIEPQTGEIRGPFSLGDDPDPRPLLKPCGTPGGGIFYDPSQPVRWKLTPPNQRPRSEPDPWHENPDMRQKLIDCINGCFPGTLVNPDDYIWDPDNPNTPCVTNCGCIPGQYVPNI